VATDNDVTPGATGQDNHTKPIIASIGALFLFLYGKKLMKVGGKGAKVYAAFVKKSAEKLRDWLQPYWANRKAIEREAKKCLMIWYGVTFAATIIWQLGTMLDPGLLRMMVSGVSRAISVGAYFWMLTKAAYPLALVMVATRWGAFEADLVQEPVSAAFGFVRWVQEQAGAVSEDEHGGRIVNTRKVVEVNDALVYGVVMVISMITTFAVVFPSPLIQLAVFASIPPLVAYLAISETRGWDNSFGWEILAKIPLFGILAIWIGAFAALILPDVFGWFLEFPRLVNDRVIAVLSHGPIESVKSLFTGTWVVMHGGRLLDGSKFDWTVASWTIKNSMTPNHMTVQLDATDRVALAFALLFVWGLIAYVCTMAVIVAVKFIQMKMGILNHKFRRREEIVVESTSTSFSTPSWVGTMVGAVAAIALFAGLGYGGYLVVKGASSSSTPTAPTATTTAVPPAPPPATTAAATGTGTPPAPPPARITRRGPATGASVARNRTPTDPSDCEALRGEEFKVNCRKMLAAK